MGTDLNNLNRLFQRGLTGPNSDAAKRASANQRLQEVSKTQEDGAASNVGAQNAFAAAFRGSSGGFTPPSDLNASQRVGGVDQTQQTSGVNFQPGIQRVQGASPAEQMQGINVSRPDLSGGSYGPASLAGGNAYDRQLRPPGGLQFQTFA